MSSAPALTSAFTGTDSNTSTLAPTPTPAPVPSTILVIEDYSDTREFLSGIFRSYGYKVIEAEDGLDGLVKAIAHYPDLIIMDLALPQMDGIETARRIHAEPHLARTPIFVVSAYLTEEVKADARSAGCVEVIAKPFDAAALVKKVARALSPGLC
jgi:CheY-like chemotaxis protein